MFLTQGLLKCGEYAVFSFTKTQKSTSDFFLLFWRLPLLSRLAPVRTSKLFNFEKSAHDKETRYQPTYSLSKEFRVSQKQRNNNINGVKTFKTFLCAINFYSAFPFLQARLQKPYNYTEISLKNFNCIGQLFGNNDKFKTWSDI